MKRFYHTIFLLIMILMATSVNAATSLTYQYDANGNLISGDGKYYEYNDANQMVKVRHSDQSGPVIAEYFYDYTGQRIKKVENGVMTYYIGKHYETQVAGSGIAKASYYFANGERVAKKDPSGNMNYYHSDHLGGTNVVTDSNGNLVERTKYYPFGEGREGGSEKYLYTGKEKDRLTDWYYYEARYYNPDFKHFTQADTFSPDMYDPQQFNRYAYVRNNPLKFIDPSGHISEKWNDKFFGPLGKFVNVGKSGEENHPNSLSYRQSSENIRSQKNIDQFPEGAGVAAKGDNIYGKGHKFSDSTQCTSYVAERFQVIWGGNAKEWLVNAKAAGFSTGDKPANKSIVVTNESDWGHVAVVESVSYDEKGNQVINISERNYKFQGTGKITERTILANSNGIRGYIYTEESTW